MNVVAIYVIHLYWLLQMLVDDIGDVTITNDGAMILKLLEVEHPAAKVIASVFVAYIFVQVF